MRNLYKKLFATLWCGALGALVCQTVAADEPATGYGLSGSIMIGGTSNYVYRGVSLTAGRPTPFLFGEASNGLIAVSGLLVGNDLGYDALGRSIGNLEADATVALTPSIGIVDFNLGAKYTGYPNGRDIIVGTMTKAERDFIEFFAGAKVNIDKAASFGVTGYWSPDFYYETGAVRTIEFQGALTLPALSKVQSRLTTTVGIVHSEAANVVSPGNGYLYYNAGIEGQLDRVYFDLRYWGTDVRNFESFGQRFVLTMGLKFP